MGEIGTTDFFEDIVQITGYPVFVERSLRGYSVIVTDTDGKQAASADSATLYDAMEQCWQALCG